MISDQPDEPPPKPANRQQEYAVGHGRPPVASRFKKGQSGNPAGRPRRDRRVDIHRAIQETFLRPVVLRDGKKTRRVPRIIALIEQLVYLALKGDLPALRESYRVAHGAGVLQLITEPDQEIDLARVGLTDEERTHLISITHKLQAARRGEYGADGQSAGRFAKGHRSPDGPGR